MVCGPTSAVVTARRAEVSIDDVTVTEGENGTQTATFTVSLNTSRPDLAIDVDYATADDTASAPADYAATGGTLTFAPNDTDTTREVTIDAQGDLLDEFDEIFTVGLSNPSNAAIVDGTGTGTITDDDWPPTISIDEVSVTEGDTGTTPATFTVNLSAPSGKTITLDYETVAGTAGPGDYGSVSDFMAFIPGDTSETITVDVTGDTIDEFDESFSLEFLNPINAVIADGSGTGSIEDDDAPAELTIDDVSVAEGDAGTTPLIFTVSLSAPSGKAVTVGYATAGESALAGEDYTADGGTLTFAPGETSQQATIDVIGDTAHEDEETFRLDLFDAANAAIADLSGVGTIADDDLATFSVRLAAGRDHTCSVTIDGGANCWGNNDYGQVGDGTTTGRVTPVAVVGLSGNVAGLAAGDGHTCALTTVGAAQCWGNNDFGELGDGATVDRSTPVDVSSLARSGAAISAATTHTCAVTTAGAVQCWGNNSRGQLGDGTTTDHWSPVAVADLPSDVAAVVTGSIHTCALSTSGGVWCWGFNGAGELGDGTTTDRLTPVAVSGLSNGVSAITARGGHTCALVTGAGVRCWGWNLHGQLGDGTTTSRLTPVSVSGLSGGVAAISAGVIHSCALTTAEAVLCWGQNDYGQLGDGTTMIRLTPVAVSGLSGGVAAISAGGEHTCALTTADAVQCWGQNFYGQLGDGTTTDRLVPVYVLGYGSELSIDDATVTEGDLGVTQVTFTVTLTAPPTNTVTVDYQVTDGTAVAGDDYASTSGTLTFAPGDTSEQITIDVIGDPIDEIDETFNVVLDHATAGIADATGIGTITDDDPPPFVWVDDLAVTEGGAGMTPATFTIELSIPSGRSITVDYETRDGTAAAGTDYEPASGTLTFAPGDTSEQVTIDVIGDLMDEPDETFAIDLTDRVNAIIIDAMGVATIIDDDAASSADLSIASTADHNTITNPVGAGQRLVYTVSVTNAGPSDARDVQVIDVLPHPSTPNDARFCEVIGPATTCDTATGTPYASSTGIPLIGTLPLGESRAFQIGYTVDPATASGPMPNTSSVTSDTPDPEPANDTATITVRVDARPVASLTWSPSVPLAGATATFDGTGSTDDGPIAEYEWAFGDGTVGAGATPTHVYSTAGTYAVELTVTDAVGGIGITSRSIVIASAPPPSAGRVLRGTITRLLPFAPGAGSGTTSAPLAGARVRVDLGREIVETITDAQGAFVFTRLASPSCSGGCLVRVLEPGAGTVLVQTRVTLGASQSTTTLDLRTGTRLDQLVVSGRVLAPSTPPAQPPTIAIRVYGDSGLSFDSAVELGGPGGFGDYQLLLGQAGGGKYSGIVRVVLVENGSEIGSVKVTVPALTGSVVLASAADLQAVDPPPLAGRVLRGTITRLLPVAPGGTGPMSGPLAGARVRITTSGGITRETVTDGRGTYVFPNLNSCPGGGCQLRVLEPGSTVELVDRRVTLGASQSTTTLDLRTGTRLDQLVVSGRVLAPSTPPAQPPTIAIRVYGDSGLSFDSAVELGGPGGFGDYQLLLGQAGGGKYSGIVRVVLVENGSEIGSVKVTVPALTGSVVLASAADLQAVDPPPLAGRVLRGTITRLLPVAPGGTGPMSGPLAGARVRITTSGGITRETVTDGRGTYVFPNLNSCPGGGCQLRVLEPGSTVELVDRRVTLGASQSTTTLDLRTGTRLDQLVVSGRVLAPSTPPAQPPTIAIRVYGDSGLSFDSAVELGGPGGFGDYQLLLGQAGGGKYSGIVRVVLVENGSEIGSVKVTVPALTGSVVLASAADLQGQ